MNRQELGIRWTCDFPVTAGIVFISLKHRDRTIVNLLVFVNVAFGENSDTVNL